MAQTSIRQTLAAVALAAAIALIGASASAFETKAEQAILIDEETGTVLFEKNADDIMFPASMSKIMTVYMVFERLRDERLALDDTVLISEKAWRTGGSKMFIEVGKQVTIEDLLRGIIIQSGNDASVAVAEALGGSEEAFADLMTEKARELGLVDTVFRNATGLPDAEHVTTARELAVIAEAIINEFPDYYGMFREKTYTFNEIKQGNRNPLLYKDLGADGLKTGHTEASGYGLTASLERNGRRLVMVLNGMESVRERSEEAEKLANWGFREFENYPLFKAGEVVETAETWLGEQDTVPLVLDEDLTITLPRRARKEMEVTVAYDGPVPVPIAKGAEIATLIVTAPEVEPIERPLYATTDVAALSFFGRISGALGFLVFGSSAN